MVRITDDRSNIASLKPGGSGQEPVVCYDRPIDSAWTYVVHGRREVWQCNDLFRESALRGLGGLVERLRRHSESHPGIGMVLTYRDLTEPAWQERVGREIREGEMWVAKQVAVRSIAFREHGILVDFVAEPGSTDAVRNLLDLLTQAASWCQRLVRRDDVNDPLLWWAFELVRLAWGPHPALHAQRKFSDDLFTIDVEDFAFPHSPGSFLSLVYELVGTAPRSWYAELSVDLASASAYLAEYFIVKLEQASRCTRASDGITIANPARALAVTEQAAPEGILAPKPLIDQTQRLILQAMIESFGAAKPGERCCPSGTQLALAALGTKPHGAFKRCLSELVSKGLIGNQRAYAKRGGYFLTESGRAYANDIRGR